MTNEEYIYVVINAAIYIGWLYLYWKRVRTFTIGMLLLSIWAASAGFALLYEPNNYIGHYHKIQLWPFFFMFILNLIAFSPVLKFRHDRISIYKANTEILIVLGIVIGLLSALPLIENSVYAVTHSSDAGYEHLLENMNERYADKDYNPLQYLSKPSFYCTRLLGWFGLNILTLLLMSFPILIDIRKHKWAFIGIIMGNLNFMLQSINIFARFNIAIHLIMFLCSYVIVYRFYSYKARKKINKIASLTIAAVASIFIVVTMYRLQGWNEQNKSSEQGIAMYIGQYLCEGMPNFSADRSRAKVFDKIEEMEYGVRASLLREKNIPKNRSHDIGYRGELVGPQFSTWIGNFYLSLGPFWIVVVFAIASFLIMCCIPNGKVLTFSQCFIFIAYLRMMILGICYNTYAVGADELSGEILLLPLIMIFERKRMKSVNVSN